MLSMALGLAFFSMIIEVVFVCNVKALRNFMVRFEKIGLAFSFALSFLFGSAFGAHGVIALFAGLMSTACMIVIYKTHALTLYDKYKENESVIHAKATEAMDLTVRALVFWWKVFIAPIKFAMLVKRKSRNTKIRIQHAYRKITGIHLPSFRRETA